MDGERGGGGSKRRGVPSLLFSPRETSTPRRTRARSGRTSGRWSRRPSWLMTTGWRDARADRSKIDAKRVFFFFFFFFFRGAVWRWGACALLSTHPLCVRCPTDHTSGCPGMEQ